MSVGKGSINRVNNINKPEKNVIAVSTPINSSNLLNIDKLISVPEQWFFYDNTYFELEALKSSIKKFGVLEPVIVRALEDDIFQLLSGYKRIKAASEVGLQQIKCEILYNIDDKTAKEIFLELNKDKHPIDQIHKTKFTAFSKIKHDLPDYLL